MKTDKWKCPSCGRADTEPMYNICECGTELERVTCLQPAEGELVEMQCPELRILSEEDMSNPQHPDFACHKKQCKLLGHICLRELTRGTDCPLYLWLLKQTEPQPAEGELTPCPVAKECEKATGMGCTSEIEGPHYPEPHRWCATCEIVDGIVVRVK